MEDEHEKLLKQIGAIDSEAEAFLRNEANREQFCIDRGTLLNSFLWDNTPQGWHYWDAIHEKLEA